MRHAIVASLVVLTLGTAGPATPAEEAAGLGKCVLVVSGTGTRAGNEKVTAFWHQVNTSIATTLVEQLSAEKVPVRSEVISVETSDKDVPGKIALALARERCDQLLQFRHELGGGSGPDAFFGFEATVFGVEPSKNGFKIGRQAFRKDYRFALNDEVLKTFSLSEMATTLKGDLSSAAVLPAKTGAALSESTP